MKHIGALLVLLTFFLKINAQNNQVTGRLIDGNSAPLPGATVHLLGGTVSTITENDGSFSLLNIPVGKHQIAFVYLGMATDTLSINIEPGQTLRLAPFILKEKINVINEVVISSSLKQGGESKAINLTKNADQLITVISAENISKYPDHNGAEALKRVAGAAVQYDKGEGAYISLRGTPLDWTATLVNGDRLPIADEENFTRIFEFEVLPSELVDYIVLTRTSTPNIDGDNVGGSINFQTKHEVDRRIAEISVSGGTSLLTTKPTGNFHFVWADISKNKKFSYAINASYYGRYYGAQSYLLAYGSNYNQSINRFELKDYDGTRQTAGANIFVQYKFNEKFKLSATMLAGTMLDDKWQRKQMFVYSSGEGSTMNLQNIHGKLNRLLAGGSLDAEYKPTARLKLTAHLSSFSNRFWYGNVPYSHNDPRNGYYAAEFSLRHPGYYTDESTVTNAGSSYLGKLLNIDSPDPNASSYRNIQPKFSYPIAADSFEFRRLFTQINNTKEKNPVVAQLDATYTVKNRITISAGAKVYYKTGERDISYHEWQFDKHTQAGAQSLNMTSLNLQPFNTRGGYLPEYGKPYDNLFMPFLTKPQLTAMIDQFSSRWFEYTMNEQNQDYWLWVGSSYKYSEYTSAGYIMADATLFGKLNLTGGLRIESNIMNVSADTLGTTPIINYSTGYVYYATEKRSVTNQGLAILPSLNATLFVKDNQNLRFAVSRTYHRQNFAELKPGAGVINYNDLEFTFGNPNLKPTYSVNLDLAYEYFWGNKGMFSLGTYYKNITNHIFATTQADVDPSTGIIYKSYQNSGKSWVWGAEAMIKRRFDFLPKALSGFGVDANITYSYSRMQVPGRPGSQPLAEQTPLLYNAAIFYEKYGVSARIALNYTGPFLKELNLAAEAGTGLLHKDASYDIFMAQNYSLDAQLAYSFKKHFTVFLSLNNLLDSPYFEYRGDNRRPIRVEYYRQRGEIGFKWSLE